MAYVYKGTARAAEPEPIMEPGSTPATRPASTPIPRPRVFDPSKCGTHAGYKQHQRYDIEACDRCLAANREYHSAWRAAQPPKAPRVRAAGIFDPEFCGTPQGYDRHIRNNTATCLPCRGAHTERHRAYRETRRAA